MEFVTDKTLLEYENFVLSHKKGHFMQSRLWAPVKPEWSWHGVISRDDAGEINGAMSLLIRKIPIFPASIMYSPRGPVCGLGDEKTLKALVDGAKELAKEHKCYVLKMDPDVNSDNAEFKALCEKIGFKVSAESKNFEAIQPRFVFRLYLDGRGEEELMASFHTKTRYNIRLAERKGVKTRLGDESDVEDFHRIMMETGLRDGFVIRSASYFKLMLKSLGDHARLYMADYEGRPVAGTLAIHYGDKVWYLYGASSNESRNVMPNYLLQWEMIRWAVEKNARIYDFRGVSGNIDESHPLYGLYRFKKGFNGEFTEFIGEMNYVFSPFMNKLITFSERAFRSLRKTLFLIKNKNKANNSSGE